MKYISVALLLVCILSASALASTQEKDTLTEKVSFKNDDIAMSGILHFPGGFEKTSKYSAIVCSNAAGAVKEQAAGLYASKLVKYGFVVLTFDASHQGESGGEPRYLEDPSKRTEDIRKAVDYLTTLPFIDAERIGGFGICAGGGYCISAAMTDHRIKAIATVSATDAGAVMREGWLGNVPVSEQIKMLEEISKQRTAEANGAPPMYVPYAPEILDDSITIVTMREAHDYYRTPRGGHPNSVNKALFTSLDKILGFSAFHRLDTLLTQPLLAIAGSESDALYLSERAVEIANCEKELFIVEGATHVDLYDIPKHVDVAEAKLGQFFTTHLSTPK
jgi:fermentation-respiration switch protein FrsA (DUF1100 family)